MKAFQSATVVGLLFQRCREEAFMAIVEGLRDSPTPEFCALVADLFEGKHHGWKLKLSGQRGKLRISWTEIVALYHSESSKNDDMEKVVVGRVCKKLKIGKTTVYDALETEARVLASMEDDEAYQDEMGKPMPEFSA